MESKADRALERNARRALAKTLVLALFAIPLLMNPWGHSMCGRVKEAALWLAAGLAGWWLAVLWTARPGRMALPDRLARPVALWLAVTGVTVLTAAARPASLWAFLSLLPYLVLAIAVGVVARRSGGRRRLLLAWSASAGLVSAYAILHHYIPDYLPWTVVRPLARAAGSIGAPVFLGSYLAMALPFAVALSGMRRAPRWLPAAIGLMVAALAVTYSRAAWAAAAAGVLATFYASTRASQNRLPVHVRYAALGATLLAPMAYGLDHRLGLAVAGIVGAALVWWVSTLDSLRPARRALAAGLVAAGALVFVDVNRPALDAADRIVRAADTRQESSTTRVAFWNVAMGLAMQRPMLGWGPDGFRVGVAASARDGIARPLPLLYPHVNPHSEWYGAAVEGGIIGLAAWLFVVLALASVAVDRARLEQGQAAARPSAGPEAPQRRRSRALSAAAVFGAVTAFGIQGILTPRAPMTALGLALAWGLATALEPLAARRIKARAGWFRIGAGWFKGRPAALTLLGTGAIWTGLALLVAGLTFSADMIAGRGDRFTRAGHNADAVDAYSAAAALFPMELDYRRVWGESALRLADTADGTERLRVAWSAYKAFSGCVTREPGNGAWNAGCALALGHLRPASAVSCAETATRLAPTSAYAWWSLACAHRANGAAFEEKSALRRSVENVPLNPHPHVRLAEVFRAEGKGALADDILAWAADNYPDWNELRAYRGRTRPRADRRVAPEPHR